MFGSITKPGKEGVVAVIVLFLVTLVAAGCVSVRSFPTTARPGDTVVLAVGSPDGMTAGNTSASFTSNAGGGVVPLTIRSIFKLYPDKTSAAWLNSNAINVEIGTGHGPWTTMIAIDLPTTGLLEGPGVVDIATSATYPPSPARDINDAGIVLEILPAAAGLGASNPFTYEVAANLPVPGDLSQLEPERRLVVKPIFTGVGSTTYGAIEVKLDIPALTGFTLTDIRIIADEKIRFSSVDRRIHYIWSQQGSEITVSFISPVGGLEYYQSHFSIISPTIMAAIDAGAVNVSTLTPVVTYYDVNGNQIAGGDQFEVIDET